MIIPKTKTRKKRKAGSLGMTLIEVIISTVILAGLLGVVLAIYFKCGENWRRGITESRAQSASGWALERIAPDVRKAMSISPFPHPYEGYGISLELPARTYDSAEKTYFNVISTNAAGQPYLPSGNTVNYFRGTTDGNPALSGDCLWRVVNAPDGTELRREIVAQGLIDNPVTESGEAKPMFIYWPDIYRLKSLETTLTVKSKESAEEAVVTLVGQTALRNR